MANFNPATVKRSGKELWTHNDVLFFILVPLSLIVSIITLLFIGE